MSQPIGTAIIGSGIFVRAEHLPAVLGNSNLYLKAIYSRSLKSAQETASQIHVGRPVPDLYSDDSPDNRQFKDLLQRDDIQAVIIALPIVAQPSFIKAALSAGKHVLAEKPVAKDIATAQKLISFYRNLSNSSRTGEKPIYAVAENFRFQPRFLYARDQVRSLGRIQHFAVKVMNLMKDENKYYKTAWRTNPEYQGGFLLDAGVHHAAVTRLFLRAGTEDEPVSVQAATNLVREHLAPVDTVTAIVKTRSGATGTFYHSAGSLMSAFEWDVACEKGRVTLSGDVITVVREVGDKKEEEKKRFDYTTGVKEEVAAWAEAVRNGRENAMQTPELALGDLEFLEKMFVSGGEEKAYEFQGL